MLFSIEFYIMLLVEKSIEKANAIQFHVILFGEKKNDYACKSIEMSNAIPCLEVKFSSLGYWNWAEKKLIQYVQNDAYVNSKYFEISFSTFIERRNYSNF